jgi:hypothetical protein
MCCTALAACMNDPACKATDACQYNCYNGVGPDGGMIGVDAGDNCANSCAGQANPNFMNYLDCIVVGACQNACLCP